MEEATLIGLESARRRRWQANNDGEVRTDRHPEHGGMFICPSGLYATARAARIAKAEQLAPRYRTELLQP